MASGKKQYVINTTAWGNSFVERSNKFEAHRERLTDSSAPITGANIYSATRQKQSLAFYKLLMRNDSYLDDLKTPNLKHAVDPIRVLTNRLWSVKGSGNEKEALFLSGGMTTEAEGEVYNSQPFDIVFSDTVTKTGDGILPPSIEDLMIKWRDLNNGETVTSGLFPVYQENIKLIPIESTFNQYYLAMTGLTAADIALHDTLAEDPQYGDKIRATQIGSIYQKEGSVYLWNLMRYFIGSQTQVTKAKKGTAYEDYSSYVNVPFNRLEARIMSFDGTSAHVAMASEYNFYSFLYEKFSKDVPELLLPCMLLQQAADSRLGDPETGKIANDNISLGGAIKLATCGNVTGKKKRRDANASETMLISSAYWHEFGAVLAKVVNVAHRRTGQQSPQDIDALANSSISRRTLSNILKSSPAAAAAAGKMRNLVFSGDYGQVITDSDFHRENYPMYADISFTADHFAQFSDHVNDAGLMTDLIDSLIASEEGNSNLIQDIHRNKKPELAAHQTLFEAKPQMKIETRMDGGITIGQVQSIQPKRRSVLDVEAWLHKVLNNKQDTQKMTGRLHAHANGLSGDGMSNSLEKQIKTIIALGKIKDMVADYIRKYSQVLNGTPAYAETVVYQVTKRLKNQTPDGNRESGKFIQNFWFSNSSDITNINFIDTQVRYGKKYIYEIWAHTLIIGTKYDIGNKSLDLSPMIKSVDQLNTMLKKGDQTLKTMVFKDAPYTQAVWYTPSLKIVKTLIAGQTVRMFDSAPVPPEIEFVPYKGNNHKLLCIFKGSVGRAQMPTIHINSEYAAYGPTGTLTEAQVVARQREYQSDEILPGENLLYESDDRPEVFEVYRTTKAPYSYSDFDGKMHARVSTMIPSEKETFPANSILPKYGDSATMVDIIMPNKKYYYTVRQVDVHKNFSNPSPVFEVEMVDQQGMIYPVITEYRFKDPIPKTNRKYFNKHIKIAPSVQQILINTGQMTSAFDATNGSVQLGTSDANIWGKKYKVRVTSTTTGKSADLNIDFNQKHKKSTAETEGTDVRDKETGVRMKTKDITAGSSGQQR
jgi:hypothetical protein